MMYDTSFKDRDNQKPGLKKTFFNLLRSNGAWRSLFEISLIGIVVMVFIATFTEKMNSAPQSVQPTWQLPASVVAQKQRNQALLEKASNGDAAAQYQLALSMVKSHNPRQFADGVEWLKQAAQQNHIPAIYDLGRLYTYGKESIPRDSAQAEKWFRTGADMGHAASQNSLGWLYRTGAGVTIDFEKAAYWFDKSARQHYATAQVNLALLHRDGLLGQRDYVKTYYWITHAIENKNKQALEILKNLKPQMTPDQIGLAEQMLRNHPLSK